MSKKKFEEYEELYGDEFEGHSPMCRECDTVMEYSAKLERFKCPMCDKEIEEDDLEDYSDVPFGCQTCGGPYPSCTTSCKMFD